MTSIDITPFEHDLLVGERILWTGRPNVSSNWLLNHLIVNEHLSSLSKTHYAISTHRVFVYQPRQKSTMPIEKIKSLGVLDSLDEQGRKIESLDRNLFVGDSANNLLMMERLIDSSQVFALLVSIRAKEEFLQPTNGNLLNDRLQGEHEMWAFTSYIRFGTYLTDILLKPSSVFWGLLGIVGFIIFAVRNLELLAWVVLLCSVPLFLVFGAFVLDTKRRYSKHVFPRYVITDLRILTQVKNGVAIAFIDSLETISQINHWRYPNTIDLHTPGMPWLTRLDDPDAVMRLLAELQAKAKRERTG